jgi:hypothetical protein
MVLARRAALVEAKLWDCRQGQVEPVAAAERDFEAALLKPGNPDVQLARAVYGLSVQTDQIPRLEQAQGSEEAYQGTAQPNDAHWRIGRRFFTPLARQRRPYWVLPLALTRTRTRLLEAKRPSRYERQDVKLDR